MGIGAWSIAHSLLQNGRRIVTNYSTESWLTLSAAFCLCLALTGCADGPFNEMYAYNPFHKDGPEETEFGPTPRIQVAAISGLANSADRLSPQQQEQFSADLFERLRNEPDPAIREHIVNALGAFSTEVSAQGLRMALGDAVPTVRVAACEAWGKRGGSDGVEALSRTLGNDEEVDVRLAAARALGEFPDSPQVIKALGIALESRDPALQHRGVVSLKKISKKDYGNDLGAWRRFAAGENPPLPAPPSVADRLREWSLF